MFRNKEGNVEMFKRIALIAAALFLTAAPIVAQAGTTCTRVGNYTYCNDSSGGSVTCNRVGNYTYCN